MAKYDLLKAKATLNLQALKTREASLWRYEEVLLVDQDDAVTLGEGFTPLLKTRNLGEAAGFNSDMQPTILVKDESANPTGSFKARGLCMAISVMRKLGGDHAALPTAGNAGAAAAAYSARAGIKCHVAMPTDTPKAMID
ncbi:MAG: pyridoxal-phosphate dependent enzyme, partial [Dehalococcoidia bacterium]|nr:pyridoxal-phosphate dependent enzyme [Dehalococcoidia bacterium]